MKLISKNPFASGARTRQKDPRGQLLLVLGAALAVAGCVSTAKQTALPKAPSRDFLLSYVFTVRNTPDGSQKLDIWVPVPKADAQQEIAGLEVRSPYPYSVYTDPEYGNSLLKIEANGDFPESLRVELRISVTRAAFQKGDGASRTAGRPADGLQRFLLPDRLVPIDGRIAEEARKVVKNDAAPLEKARAIYDHLVATMSYDKSGTGWGRGDALYACDARRGNCTDFHSLFIGMARASGIPARFVMGFPVPKEKSGEIPGYHCWAEFYIEGMGWLPVDASEAWKHPEKKEFFFGNLDANRVAFSLGRDIRLDPSMEPVNYLIYPYVMINGKPYSDVETRVRFAEAVH